MAKKINITAQLNAATTDGILADAGQIFDTKKGKFQEQVNQEFEDALEEAITSEETDKVVESIEEGIVHNALRKTKQILTEAEKYQARHNISAITAEEAEKIAQDKINETSVSSPDKLQAVKELSSWLEKNPDSAATMNAAIQDNAADIQRLYRGTGIDEYSQFSTGMDYAAGDVVLYDGVLFRFKADHAKGEWDYNEVEEWSEKKEREEKVNELSKKVVLNLSAIVATNITDSLNDGEYGYLTGNSSLYYKKNGIAKAKPLTKDGLYRYKDVYYKYNGAKLVPLSVISSQFASLEEALNANNVADRVPNSVVRFYDTTLNKSRVLIYSYHGENPEYIGNYGNLKNWTEVITEQINEGASEANKNVYLIKGTSFPTKALVKINEDSSIYFTNNEYSSISNIIPIPSDCKIIITFTAQTNETNTAVVFLDENKQAVSSFTATEDLIQREYNVPDGAKYVIFCCINDYVDSGAYYGFKSKNDFFYIDFVVSDLENKLENKIDNNTKEIDANHIDTLKRKKVSRNDFFVAGIISATTGENVSNSKYNYTTGIKPIPQGVTKITAMCSQGNASEDNSCIVLLDESYNVVANCGANSRLNVLEIKEIDIPESAVYYAINCSVAKVSEAFYILHQPDIDSLLVATNKDFNIGGYISDVDGTTKSTSAYNYTTGIKRITAVKSIHAKVAQTTVTADHGAIIFLDKDKKVIASYKNSVNYKLENIIAKVPDNAFYYAINCEAKSIAEACYELVVDKNKAINNITHPNELKERNQVSVFQSSQPDIIIASHKGFRFGNNDKVYTFGSPYAYINASKLGYRWWEVDIQLTSDNHWVVVHDAPLSLYAKVYDKQEGRLVTTEDNLKVSQFTLSEIRDRFEWEDGGKIMTLLEVFRLANSCNCNMVLEFKSNFSAKEAAEELKTYCQLFGIHRIVYNCTSTNYASIFPKLIDLGIYAAGSASMISATKEKMLAMFEFAKSVGNTVVGYYSSSETIEDEWMIEKALEYGVLLQGSKFSSKLPYCVVVSDDMCRKLNAYLNEYEIGIGTIDSSEYKSVYQLNLEKPTNVCVTFMAEEGIKCKIGNFEIEESTIVSYVLNKGSYSLSVKGSGKINTLILQW